MIEVNNQTEFEKILDCEIAIVYILVNWSGPERISRQLMFDAFKKIDSSKIQIFKIDCSEQTNTYVHKWLLSHGDDIGYLYFHGYGETLLVKKGNIIDYIKNPGQLNSEKITEKMENWSNLFFK